MRIKKMILYSAVQIPGIHNGEMKDQIMDIDVTASSLGVVLDVPHAAAAASYFKLADDEEMEALIPWAQIRVLYRKKEAPKK